MNIDPRPYVVNKRLSGVKRVIAVTGWKGGIGKSVTACGLALLCPERGFKTGLFDMDMTGSSCHIILGAGKLFPKEENGIVPPEVRGVHFMSSAFFSGNMAVPFRGSSVSEAMLELLAITQWGELEFLFIDMPPGIGDASLDAARWIKRAQMLVVSTPARLSVEVAQKPLELFSGLGITCLGVIENMSGPAGQSRLLRAGNKKNIQCLGRVRFDPGLERAIGNPSKIVKTVFAKDLRKIAKKFAGGG